MSINRICPNCFKVEDGIRINFKQPDGTAAREFHQQNWCDCGYSSPEEMMKDKGFCYEDPQFYRLAQHFLKWYHHRFSGFDQHHTEDEQIGFFLKRLKGAAQNVFTDIELKNKG